MQKTLLWLTTLGRVGATALFISPRRVAGAGDRALILSTISAPAKPYRRLPARTGGHARSAGSPAGAGHSATSAGCAAGASLAYIGRAQEQGRCGRVRAGRHADHRRDFCAGEPAHVLMLRERAVPNPGHTRTTPGGRCVARSAICPAPTQALPRLHRAVPGGIAAVITLAAIYASQVFHFDTQRTILLVLLVNITAALGAFVFGHVQDRIGHVQTVALTLAGWIAMVMIAWAAPDERMFWVAANLAGLCMGASQSAGRAMVGLLAPPAQQAEFFGLWGLAVKLPPSSVR
jgi:UMF1 family MFS transporter